MMTGPWGLSRMLTFRDPAQRTLIVSTRALNASFGNCETSTRSLVAAWRLVPPQAIHGLRPEAMKGSPGSISPTA